MAFEARMDEFRIPNQTGPRTRGNPPTITGGVAPPPYLSLRISPRRARLQTREQLRRQRRERLLARNRMMHARPNERQLTSRNNRMRSTPAEITPNNSLPPPYTTLPRGDTVLPVPIFPAIVPVHQRRTAADFRHSFPISIMSLSSEHSRKGCCIHWPSGSILRILILLAALSGVTCVLGGTAIGVSGIGGSPKSHLTGSLLMVGVGVILVTFSGLAWRMSAPDALSYFERDAHNEAPAAGLPRGTYRPAGGNTSNGLLYPEFQYRPPPPSYLSSMRQNRFRLTRSSFPRSSQSMSQRR
ncbi:uncharacterized protein LOC129769143 [Toxorhynchites rutilus septentrionalis]|uniref:uncharacterized protein LOC129769143 n=1 Tax=Toxorhynchites rutilus septentrionalis TaxID=329112 RepID=UPI00247AE7D3|nr:uncharacterized protein LOC129769143 [Toxorhynchites rutilus septentrionalis]